jgi:glucose/arabinose dehydrogenase
MGLRSFAFHPDFTKAARPGFRKLYTVHTEAAAEPEGSAPLFAMTPGTPVHHHNVLTEWGARPTEPLVIDPDSRREVLRIAQNRPDHCTDQLVFNPAAMPGDDDYGMIYIGTGDGGNTPEHPDRYEHAQDPTSALGKILRIDPLRQADGGCYRVPADNPFVGRDGWLPEIWALGLRHPQNLSFDRPTGTLVLADIGQFFIEEVNLGVRGGNYGWPRREGTFATDRVDQTRLHALPDDDASFGYVYPVAQYDHDEGETREGTPIAKGRVAITGGFVYRDVAIPALAGQYLFGDLVNGRVFHVALVELVPGRLATIHEVTLTRNHVPVTLQQLVGTTGRVDLRFGQDERGAIYLLTKQDGAVRKLVSG